jgi:hypothetical protein
MHRFDAAEALVHQLHRTEEPEAAGCNWNLFSDGEFEPKNIVIFSGIALQCCIADNN